MKAPPWAGRCAATVPLYFALVAATPAATIQIVVGDSAGEGFNDPDPPVHANQVGNNPGASLGELRMNVFNAVGAHWGALLNSTVTIKVNAQFNPQACFEFSGTLGSASTAGTGAASTGSRIRLITSRWPNVSQSQRRQQRAERHFQQRAGRASVARGGGFYYGLTQCSPAPRRSTPWCCTNWATLSDSPTFSTRPPAPSPDPEDIPIRSVAACSTSRRANTGTR
jgi:hypothetical protein